MTHAEQPTSAQHLTTGTPNGPFTVIHEAGTVLASGWTDDPGYLLALIHPSLRPESVEPGGRDADGRTILAAVDAYYDGDPAPVDVVGVHQAGGAFLEQAWKVLRTVGPGQTRTYTEFAELAGNGAAVRAAAMACARNAAALFVPCHRIQRTDGTLGGFRYGLETKRWLLDFEAAKD